MGEFIRIIEPNLDSYTKEAYNSLRANVQFCLKNKDIKVLTVISYNKGEGRTVISLSLAVSMAKTGARVLWVDADLRKPLESKNYSDTDIKGLANIFTEQITTIEAVNGTNVDGLYCIEPGSKVLNPGELISSKKCNQFLQDVREQYDIVIIDTPPLSRVIDGAVIASQTDGALIVIASSKTKRNNVITMKEQLNKANVNIIGAVLNKVPKRGILK